MIGSINRVITNPMLFASSSFVRLWHCPCPALFALLLLEEGGDQLSSDIAQSGQAAKY